jgi:hypothetical protein
MHAIIAGIKVPSPQDENGMKWQHWIWRCGGLESQIEIVQPTVVMLNLLIVKFWIKASFGFRFEGSGLQAFV